MEKKYILIVLLLLISFSSCQNTKLFQKNNIKPFLINLNEKKVITLSVKESKDVADYFWMKGGEVSLYSYSDARDFAKPIMVKKIYETRLISAFKRIFPNKKISVVDADGDFIIDFEYYIGRDRRLYLKIKLFGNIKERNNGSKLFLNDISEKEIDCKVSIKYDSNRSECIRFFELYHKEWKPEKYTEEVGVWLENALQKYLLE